MLMPCNQKYHTPYSMGVQPIQFCTPQQNANYYQNYIY